MKTCRICGDDLGRIPITERVKWAVYLEPSEPVPEWAQEACADCLQGAVSFMPSSEDEDRLTETQLLAYTAQRLAIMADRARTGRPLIRCEVVKPSTWAHHNGDGGARCKQFAIKEFSGRQVCGSCEYNLRSGRGRDYAFCGEPTVRPFIIWAATGEDLIWQASMLAACMHKEKGG